MARPAFARRRTTCMARAEGRLVSAMFVPCKIAPDRSLIPSVIGSGDGSGRDDGDDYPSGPVRLNACAYQNSRSAAVVLKASRSQVLPI